MLSRPRQTRMIDTRPQQLLGCFHPAYGAPQMDAQFLLAIMCAIGQIPLAVRPNLFYRIQFRRVRRKSMHMKSLMLSQKFFDCLASMNLSAVPDQDDTSPQMTQEIAKKRDDFVTRYVLGVQANVQSQFPPSRRHRQNANNRYLLTPVSVFENRGLANRTPCPANIRNQKESGLIKKPHVGPKSSGFFLYRARRAASSGEWPPRPSPRHGVPVSGNSIPTEHAATSISLPQYSVDRSVFESTWRCAAASTNQLHVQRPLPPSKASSEGLSSVCPSTGRGGPINLALADLCALFPYVPDTIALQNSTTPSSFERRPETNIPGELMKRPDDDAFPADRLFLGVSSPVYNMYPLLVKDQ